MKHFVFILITFVLYKPIFGQNNTYQNSTDTSCKFFQGRLTENMLDSCVYIYTTSERYSFIEFTSWRKGIMMKKYRVEKLSNPRFFIITKTNAKDNDSNASYLLAIDSSIFNAIKMRKQYFKELTNKNIYRELNLEDSIVLSLFSKFIKEHNLQTDFSYFKPRSFVAWLRIKS